MRKEIISADDFSLFISFLEEDFDYYSDIQLELEYKRNKYIILSDNLLELYNIVNRYRENGIPLVTDKLDIHSLGTKLSDIYQYDLDDENEIEKYCAYVSLDYMTWIFKKDNAYYFMITPAYRMQCEESDDYESFKKNYSEIICSKINIEKLETAAKRIEEIYNIYMK